MRYRYTRHVDAAFKRTFFSVHELHNRNDPRPWLLGDHALPSRRYYRESTPWENRDPPEGFFARALAALGLGEHAHIEDDPRGLHDAAAPAR